MINIHILTLVQYWIIYLMMAIPIVVGLFLLIKRWLPVEWTYADTASFIVPFWFCGVAFLLSPPIHLESSWFFRNIEAFSAMRSNVIFYGLIFILTAPLANLFLKVICMKSRRPLLSGWIIIAFYCIISALIVAFVSVLPW